MTWILCLNVYKYTSENIWVLSNQSVLILSLEPNIFKIHGMSSDFTIILYYHELRNKYLIPVIGKWIENKLFSETWNEEIYVWYDKQMCWEIIFFF